MHGFAGGPFFNGTITMAGHHTHPSVLAVSLVALLAGLHLARPFAPGIRPAACQAGLASPLASLAVVARRQAPALLVLLMLPRVVPFLSLLSHCLV